MSVFQYQDYKKFVLDKVKAYPAGGHGVFKKISEALSIPPSTLSLVFKGDRDLTAEQAIEIAEFFGLGELEIEYFMVLVERNRAGNPRLRKFTESRLAKTRLAADNLKNRVPNEKVLGENEKHVFYSEWYYSAIRMLTGIPGFQRPPAIAEQLGLSLALVQRALGFLASCGLVKEKNGSYSRGAASTHVGPDDPLAFRHLQNWHQQSVHRLIENPQLDEHELCISMPCTTSKEAVQAMKQALLDAMLKVVAEIDAGKDEKFVFLNIDLLDGRKRAPSVR